jgi:RimJ/RimL family protein N-acetyltransferase
MHGLPTLPEHLVLRTSRLDLIPINRGHAAPMFDILSSSELYVFTGAHPPKNVEMLADQYARWENRLSPDGTELWLNWILHLRSENQLIGHVQAGVSSDHADVAWVVGVHWQKRGFATEAATEVLEFLRRLDVRRVRASIHPENISSIKAAQHLGLQPTKDRSNGEVIWQLWRE